jgi:hypothetical protein
MKITNVLIVSPSDGGFADVIFRNQHRGVVAAA